MHNYSRRQALVHLAGIAGALALTGSTPLGSSAQSLFGNNADDDERDELPPPATSGIEHIVVVMMENRSFDHFLGWLPGADGWQAGLGYADETGTVRTNPHL